MRITILVIALMTSMFAEAQNLVPNPSFEDYVNCPANTYELPYSTNYTGFLTVNGWCNAVKLTSPDYYNVCAGLNTVASVPKNPWGYQQPRTGDAYIGIITHREVPGIQDFSEYIYCKLTAPLQAGKLYYVSFYVSATAETQYNGFIDRIGVKFSDTIIHESVIHRLYGSYDLRSTQGVLLNDTVNWVQISGKYKAKGGERFMTIGNFYDSSTLKTDYIGAPPSNLSFYAYYYIDDVSVVDSNFCDTSYNITDTLLCNNDSIILRSPIVGGKNFEWSTGATDTAIKVGQAGKYWCITLKDSCDYYVDTFRVGTYGDTLHKVADTSVCLFDSDIYIKSSIDAADEYAWSTGGNTQMTLIADTGTYYCYVIKACSVYREEINVRHVAMDTTYSNTDTSFCLYTGNGINIRSALNNADVYKWDNNSVFQTLQITDTGKYYCIARKGCNVLYDSFKISHPSFNYSIELGNDTILCNGIELNIGKGISNEVVMYQWNTGSSNCCITPAQDGNYKLTITDGCTSVSDSINIAFEKCEQCIMMPTVFSPNNDGHNDMLRAHTKCRIEMYDFRVYNRWGEIVYRTDDILQGWDGKYKGRPVEIGEYYYLIQYKQYGNDKTLINKGDVLLLR